MEHYLVESVQNLAASAYFYALATFIALELLIPKKIDSEWIALRWVNNFLIAYTNGYLIRFFACNGVLFWFVSGNNVFL